MQQWRTVKLCALKLTHTAELYTIFYEILARVKSVGNEQFESSEGSFISRRGIRECVKEGAGRIIRTAFDFTHDQIPGVK